MAGAERGEGVAVGLARRDLVADRVPRRRNRRLRGARGLRRHRGMRRRPGPRPADGQVPLAAQFGDGALGHVRRERPAVPAVLVLDLGEAAALDGPGQHHRGLIAAQVAGGGQRLVDLGQVMTIDRQDPRAERLRAAGVGGQIPLQLGGPPLAEPVDVDHRDQVGQPVVGGLVEGLPDRALGHLTVPAQYPHPVGELVEVLPGQCDSHAVRKALAQRPGGDVHPRQHRCRVSFQP